MATPKLVKQIVLARFKKDVTNDQITDFIVQFGKLSHFMKSFLWGTDLGKEPVDLNQGYTHAFECTFESSECLQKYLDSPDLAEFRKDYASRLSQHLVIDPALS